MKIKEDKQNKEKKKDCWHQTEGPLTPHVLHKDGRVVNMNQTQSQKLMLCRQATLYVPPE
jgi:hypothetical protein